MPLLAWVGEPLRLRVRGGWPEAKLLTDVRIERSGYYWLPTANSTVAATTQFLAPGVAAGDSDSDSFDGWEVMLVPAYSGILQLGFGVESVPSCATSPPLALAVAMGGFTIECPSRTMLPGR